MEISHTNLLQPTLRPRLQSNANFRPCCKAKFIRNYRHSLSSSVESLTLASSSSSRPSSKQGLTVTCSVADDSASVDLATKPAEADSSLAVKRKAAEIANDLKGTSIFLLGMNCSMKASVGKLIADSLRYYYFDSDSLVEESGGGVDFDESFRERDADGFRQSETEVLRQLSSMGRLVVSAGNGAVQCSTNLALLRHGICLWIDVPLDVIANEKMKGNDNNFATSNGSPESSPEVLTQLIAIYEENKGGYGIADGTISVQKLASKLALNDYEQVTIEDMGLEVLNELERLTRVKKMMEEAGKIF